MEKEAEVRQNTKTKSIILYESHNIGSFNEKFTLDQHPEKVCQAEVMQEGHQDNTARDSWMD